LAQSCGNGHRLLVTPERVLSEYNKDLCFYHCHNDLKVRGQKFVKPKVLRPVTHEFVT